METFRAEDEVKHHIFGSKSSLDLDVCFFVERLGNIEQNNAVISQLLEESSISSKKRINANLAVISNGLVANCFKGIPDELNNSLFQTYSLHEQKFPLLVEKLVERNLELKMIRCARTLVSYFTRTPLRSEAKAALRGGFELKLNFLKDIDLENYDDFGKHGSVIEIYKSMAFQLGQTLGLFNDNEVYTKESIAEAFPELEVYLKRTPNEPKPLQMILEEFLWRSFRYLPNMTMENNRYSSDEFKNKK